MKTTRFVSAALLSGALLAGVAGSASATTSSRLEPTRAKCITSIVTRESALASVKARLDSARRVTADQKVVINANIDAVVANLETVNRPAVVAATDRATLATACAAVFVDNRVFAVVLPQVVFVARGDALGNGVTFLNALVVSRTAAGFDTTEAAALTTAGDALITSAETKNASVTPAVFNADPTGTRTTFESVKIDINAASLDLMQAWVLLANMT